jgi:endonuclease VIII
MPEGHLLHHHARRQRPLLLGPVAVTSPQGRFADEATELDGRTLTAVDAVGKLLLYGFEGDAHVSVHLGMQGVLLEHPAPSPEPRPQVRLRLTSARGAVDCIAPSRCELLDGAGRAALLARLGPDPLAEVADVEAVRRSLRARSVAIGAALLDQALVAGVGNVLRNEVLYLERLHPSTPAAALDDAAFDGLWTTLVAVMRRAAVEGRIITVDGAPSPAEGRYVYKQERCRGCGTPVQRLRVGGRDAYVCPREQVA